MRFQAKVRAAQNLVNAAALQRLVQFVDLRAHVAWAEHPHLVRAQAACREGQFFSILAGGRHYLHMATAITVANASGLASVPIFPMLRVSPADNAACHFAKPMIQGSLAGNEQAWVRLPAGWCDLGSISISEDE